MPFTKEIVTRQPKNDEIEYENMQLLDLLKVLNIKADDFASALVSFIESKPFAKMVKQDQKQKKANHEKSPYPDLYLHVFINFIMNSVVPVGGYNLIIDQLISGYNGDHKADTWEIHC